MPALEANVINMFESNVQLRCSKCGVTQDAACNCRAPILVISRHAAVNKYDETHPRTPIKKVAAALGVGHATVSRTRAACRENQGVQNGHPVRRVNGNDGKSYPATIKQPTRESRKTTEQAIARKLESFITIQVTLLDRARIDKKIDKKHKLELVEILQGSADKLMSLAQALDGR